MSSERLIRLLDGWQRRRIVVVGDFMLDRHAYGNAERLSPDAPVPVLSIVREEDQAGGAANVCLDLCALRCEVSALGVVGRDEPGRALRARLREAGCEVEGLIEVDDRPTTVKHSYVGLAQHRHPQKMFRVDHERSAPLADEAVERLLTAARAQIAEADVLCLEDYDKGVLGERLCQALIGLAREAGVPVLVDPAASGDYRKYRGATCLTPNRTEAEQATGMSDVGEDWAGLQRMARTLAERVELSALVLTLDKQGALLLEGDAEPVLVPTVARSVYDVTGAGDMVLAMLAGALANGASWGEATALANTAAGLEVERFGVAPIPLEEVLLAVLQERHNGPDKLRQLDHLLVEVGALRSRGSRIVFTNGCFDILHAGHVQYLRQAKRQGDVLVVGLNSDDSIRRLKGQGRPVNRAEDRVLVLSELSSVDYVVLFEADTPVELIEAIRPDVLVKGADYTREQVVGHEIVDRYGGEVVLVPLVEGRSTSNLIEQVRQQ